MYNTSALSINELELSRLSLKSDDETRGGGGRKVLSLKKLDESPSREKFHKRPSLDNPRLAKALEWCHKRKIERESCHSKPQ